MGLGALRRYHKVEESGTVPDLPAGSTRTQDEAEAAAEATALKLGNEQQEQVDRVESEDFPPVPAQSVHHVIEQKAGGDLDGETPDPTPPPGNASLAAWQAYVQQLPEDQRPEGWEEMSRDELRDAITNPPDEGDEEPPEEP